MRFHLGRFLHHIYIALFESRQRGVRMTPNRVLILFVFLFVLVPVFLTSAWISWLLDNLLFPKYLFLSIENRFSRRFGAAGQGGWRTRRRSRSNLARPYIWRLMNFRRLT